MIKEPLFNISASAYQQFINSPLLFYLNKLSDEQPDTETVKCYGLAGGVVHDCIELFVNERNKELVKKHFDNEWDRLEINTLNGLNGKPLNKIQYWNCVIKGQSFVEILYDKQGVLHCEEEIILPFYEDEKYVVNAKGYIDVTIKKEDGTVIICDWKTSSSETDFSVQSLFYHWLYFEKHGVLPSHSEFVYLKLGKKKIYKHSLDEVLSFKQKVFEDVRNIILNKDNIDWFSVGDYDTPFNEYKLFCEKIVKERSTKPVIKVVKTRDNKLLFPSVLPKGFENLLINKYKFFDDSARHTYLFKNGRWDGFRNVYDIKSKSLPAGLLSSVKELLIDYNTFTKQSYELFVEEGLRYPQKIVYGGKPESIVLRYYQEEAVISALSNKTGILALGTGAGKSIIAAEFFRRAGVRGLFIVNRQELLSQTINVFKNYYGDKVVVGSVTEGMLDLSNDLVVATVQSLAAILKRDDESSKQLIRWLEFVGAVVFDECQNVTDVGMYGVLNPYLRHNVYMIGLSGTPFRNGNDTLLMNGLVGSPIYEKSTKSLEDEGFLVPTKCFFVKFDNGLGKLGKDVTYAEEYRSGVIENDDREKLSLELINRCVSNGWQTLVITRSVEHGKSLQGKVANSVLINGSTEKVLRKESFESFKKGGVVLIGSSKIFAAGIDLPALDCVIDLTAGKSSVEVLQVVGRVKRKSPGKKNGFYVTVLDECRFLNRAGWERLKVLRKYGNECRVVENVEGVK